MRLLRASAAAIFRDQKKPETHLAFLAREADGIRLDGEFPGNVQLAVPAFFLQKLQKRKVGGHGDRMKTKKRIPFLATQDLTVSRKLRAQTQDRLLVTFNPFLD